MTFISVAMSRPLAKIQRTPPQPSPYQGEGARFQVFPPNISGGLSRISYEEVDSTFARSLVEKATDSPPSIEKKPIARTLLEHIVSEPPHQAIGTSLE